MARDKLADFGLLLLRIVLFSVLIFYGSQKMLGVFGGEGIAGTLTTFQRQNGFPQWLTMLAIVSEFCGSVAILFGLLTRLAAFGIACTMATAAYENYQRANIYKDAHLPLALLGMALALIFTGAGQFSLDWAVARGRKKGRITSR